MDKKRNPHAQWRGLLVTAVTFFLAVGVLVLVASQVAGRNDSEQTDLLQQAVLRASLTCYAVEGRYPADAAYLEEHYGVSYDHERYLIVLDGFAENILPDIRVLVKGGQ